MSETMVKVDFQKMKAFLDNIGVTLTEASRKIGKSPAYLNAMSKNGEISKTAFMLFCMVYGCKKEDLIYQEPIKKPQSSMESYGWSIDLGVSPTVLTMRLKYGNDTVHTARSKIKGNTQLDLVQAISYAAHMIYKQEEQEVLESEVNK